MPRQPTQLNVCIWHSWDRVGVLLVDREEETEANIMSGIENGIWFVFSNRSLVSISLKENSEQLTNWP